MEKITISVRGVSKGDPGPAAVGVCITDSAGNVLKEVSETMGNASNDYAEYFAVVRGLQAAVDVFADKTNELQFELQLSNETVKKQLNVEQQINNVAVVGHFIEIHNLRVSNFPNLKFTYVRQELNQVADKLVREALDA